MPVELEKFSLYLRLDRGLSPKTAEAYVSDLRPLLRDARDPDRVGADAIRGHLDRLSRRGLNPRSLARKISAFRLFFRFALAQGWCDLDPTEGLSTPRSRRPLPRTLGLDEVEALLDAPRAGADALMLRLMYAAGLRVSELVGLEPGQIDTQSGVIRVHGKGGKTRVVPIDVETAARVEQYLRAERPSRARKHPPAPALFLTPRGNGYTRQGFWKLVRRYARRAGLSREVSPHVLRHAFATHLLERGMNLRALQTLLGHSDISTTEIYAHVTTGHLAETLAHHHPRARDRRSRKA